MLARWRIPTKFYSYYELLCMIFPNVWMDYMLLKYLMNKLKQNQTISQKMVKFWTFWTSIAQIQPFDRWWQPILLYEHLLCCLEGSFNPSRQTRISLSHKKYVFFLPGSPHCLHTSLDVISWLPVVVASPEWIFGPVLIHCFFHHINGYFLSMKER